MKRFNIPALLATATCTILTVTAAPEEKKKASLDGAWSLQSWTIDGKKTAVSTAGITIKFEKKDKCSGRSGVNSYGGTYFPGKNGSLRFGALFMTEMAGPPKLMKLETTYHGLLTKVSKFEFSERGVTLIDGTSKNELHFVRKLPVIATPLQGTHWTLSSFEQSEGDTVSNSALAEGTSITLKIAKDGGVFGSSGVNSYSGKVEIGETGKVKFEGFTTTKKAGPAAHMRQEFSYLAQLRSMTKSAAQKGRLALSNQDGTTVLHFTQRKEKK